MEDGSVVPAQAIFVRFMSKFTTAMKEFQDYRGLKNAGEKLIKSIQEGAKKGIRLPQPYPLAKQHMPIMPIVDGKTSSRKCKE